MLKNRADIRTLIFAFLISATWVWNWSLAEFRWAPFLLACFWSVCISSMVHNHIHVGTFKQNFLNSAYDYWLTFFYGYPVFAWISTHNKNHHVYNNKPGDFAPPFLVSEKNNLLTLIAYPTVSGSIQQKVNFDYMKVLWKSDRKKCLYYSSQYVAFFAFLLVPLAIDWKKALLYIVIPQQIALNVVLSFNYLQHIHCDEESKYNHSRNFHGLLTNFFLFNNGYHTAHHMKPLMHWSGLKAQHEKIAHLIDPSLCEDSLLWCLARMYLLAPFFPGLRGRNMRAERMTRESHTQGLPEMSGGLQPSAM